MSIPTRVSGVNEKESSRVFTGLHGVARLLYERGKFTALKIYSILTFNFTDTLVDGVTWVSPESSSYDFPTSLFS